MTWLTLSSMTSIPPLLWRHYAFFYDFSNIIFYDVTAHSSMTSLPPLLWRHYPFFYGFTTFSSMVSPPLFYDVTNIIYYAILNIPYYVVTTSTIWYLMWRLLSPQISPPHSCHLSETVLWRHLHLYYDVINLFIMTLLTPLLWCH